MYIANFVETSSEVSSTNSSTQASKVPKPSRRREYTTALSTINISLDLRSLDNEISRCLDINEANAYHPSISIRI